MKEKLVNKVPLYKADLEKEAQDPTKLIYEDSSPDYVRESGQRGRKSLTPALGTVRKSNSESSSGKKSFLTPQTCETYLCTQIVFKYVGLTE